LLQPFNKAFETALIPFTLYENTSYLFYPNVTKKRRSLIRIGVFLLSFFCSKRKKFMGLVTAKEGKVAKCRQYGVLGFSGWMLMKVLKI
jgi:hypothetical protein